MVGTHNRPFQEAPDVLYGVGVHVATDPFFDVVVDGLMGRIFVGNPEVGGPRISHNASGLGVSMVTDEAVKGLASHVADYHHASVPATLDSTCHDGLAAPHPFPAMLLATYPGLVHFDGAGEPGGVGLAHSGPDPVAEIPGCLISDAQLALDLVRRHAFLGFDNGVGCQKPFPQRQMRVMEDGPRGD